MCENKNPVETVFETTWEWIQHCTRVSEVLKCVQSSLSSIAVFTHLWAVSQCSQVRDQHHCSHISTVSGVFTWLWAALLCSCHHKQCCCARMSEIMMLFTHWWALLLCSHVWASLCLHVCVWAASLCSHLRKECNLMEQQHSCQTRTSFTAAVSKLLQPVKGHRNSGTGRKTFL